MHGVNTSELATSIKPAVTSGNLPVIVGTSPINMAMPTVMGELPKVNQPVLCYTAKEFAENVGYAKDYENFTLTEAADVFFKLYGMAPICVINVLDPTKHTKSVGVKLVTLVKDAYTEKVFGVLKSTVVIKSADGTKTFVNNTDYVLAFTTEGYLKVIKTGTAIAETQVSIEYDMLDSSKVTEADIIGGYDIATGKTTGLELVENVFPKFRKVPTMLLCPKYDASSAVSAIMDTKMDSVNTVFRGMSIVDISDVVTNYTDVPSWKNTKNLINDNQIVCWPKVTLGDDVYRLSLHVAASMCAIDYKNGDHPLESPSNKNLKMDGTCVIKNGVKTIIDLTLPQANYLEANGVLTALNFIIGWTAWGNYTSCYPANTDPKDCYIPAKRVMQYYDNNFVLTYWVDVDKPGTPRKIDNIVDSRNEFYNGEIASEKIIDGRIAFIEEENPIIELLAAKFKFHNYITPPLPMKELISVIELDPSGYSKLFS